MRLIDADALLHYLRSTLSDLTEEDGAYEWAWVDAIHEIEHAPTVAKDINVPGKWISVKSKMPRTGHVYLITLNPPATIPQAMEAYLRHDGTWWRGAVGLVSEYVTHWMPMPEPQKEDADGGDLNQP